MVSREIQDHQAKFEGLKLDQFELVDDVPENLGKGSFGTVQAIRRKGTSEVFALKSMRKKDVIDGALVEQVETEIQVQLQLKHRNVLCLYRHFEDDESVYLLLEYCAKGELYKMLRTARFRRFPEPQVCSFFVQVADGLHYLHSNKIMHRDIKPENLLVTQEDVLKIADFGWCATTGQGKRMTFCGTLDYLAPEMVKQEGHDHTLDVWSAGVLLYEMVVGRPPFQSTNHEQLMAKILGLDYAFPPWVPQPIVEIVCGLLEKTPSDRMLLSDALKHPWVLSTCRPDILPPESQAALAAQEARAASVGPNAGVRSPRLRAAGTLTAVQQHAGGYPPQAKLEPMAAVAKFRQQPPQANAAGDDAHAQTGPGNNSALVGRRSPPQAACRLASANANNTSVVSNGSLLDTSQGSIAAERRARSAIRPQAPSSSGPRSASGNPPSNTSAARSDSTGRRRLAANGPSVAPGMIVYRPVGSPQLQTRPLRGPMSSSSVDGLRSNLYGSYQAGQSQPSAPPTPQQRQPYRALVQSPPPGAEARRGAMAAGTAPQGDSQQPVQGGTALEASQQARRDRSIPRRDASRAALPTAAASPTLKTRRLSASGAPALQVSERNARTLSLAAGGGGAQAAAAAAAAAATAPGMQQGAPYAMRAAATTGNVAAGRQPARQLRQPIGAQPHYASPYGGVRGVSPHAAFQPSL
eukprot:TRINITY_DN14065_c0_g1_i1.p1 TRINITY_DN14065_c0_g1~~TRINITY_DN14065_c0_g1_i1.p1  ORF type:complete len:694 (-),score=114.33 TRINITY_DN14065_c0_g1_i1:61-2142(-)